ncbi:MAG: hypothetical protein ACTSYD_02050 [Candidatus Heimdallarchaeaceae archaeon]
MKIDNDLKKALSFVVFFIAAGYTTKGLNVLLSRTGLSPDKLAASNPWFCLGVGILMLYLIYEWGIKK